MAYRVYRAPDGCDPMYCGEFDEYDAAVRHAESEPVGLEKCLWQTARAAGHCAGMHAPDDCEESDEPVSWHGAEGDYCVVEASA